MISAEYWADGYGSYVFGRPRATDFIVFSKDRYLETYASRNMLAEMRKFSKKLLDKKNRQGVLRQSGKVQKRYWKFYQKFKRQVLSKTSSYKLYQLLAEYVEILKYVARLFSVSQADSMNGITEELTKRLKKRGEDYLLSVLITATTPDIIFQEQADLQKIARLKRPARDLFYKHALNHAWLFFNSYDAEENITYLKERLGEGFDAIRKLEEMKKLKKRQEVIFRGAKDTMVKELSLFLQNMAVDRLRLKNCWGGSEFRFLPLFQEMAKRMGISLAEMMASYTLRDCERGLLEGKKLERVKIGHRKKHFVFWKQGDKLLLIEDAPSIEKITKRFHGQTRPLARTEIFGVSVNRGKARGICRKVQSLDIHNVLKDLKRFKKGNILVTWMTQPNMVPIAKKAAAIVADEGGITSHAAVLAREFNIPCVVGTRIATKILRDGDLIEVDANLGAVRKV